MNSPHHFQDRRTRPDHLPAWNEAEARAVISCTRKFLETHKAAFTMARYRHGFDGHGQMQHEAAMYHRRLTFAMKELIAEGGVTIPLMEEMEHLVEKLSLLLTPEQKGILSVSDRVLAASTMKSPDASIRGFTAIRSSLHTERFNPQGDLPLTAPVPLKKSSPTRLTDALHVLMHAPEGGKDLGWVIQHLPRWPVDPKRIEGWVHRAVRIAQVARRSTREALGDRIDWANAHELTLIMEMDIRNMTTRSPEIISKSVYLGPYADSITPSFRSIVAARISSMIVTARHRIDTVVADVLAMPIQDDLTSDKIFGGRPGLHPSKNYGVNRTREG